MSTIERLYWDRCDDLERDEYRSRGLFFWRCAGCFSNRGFEKDAADYAPAGAEASGGQGLTPPLHPR